MESIEEAAQILKEVFELDIEVDGYGGFQIDFEALPVQVESDASGQKILVLSELGELPGGAFRENVLEAALKFNGSDKHKGGIFSFSPQGDLLILFYYVPLRITTPDAFVTNFNAFVELAKSWHEEIHQGRVPDVDTGAFGATSGSGFMGMQ